VAAIAAAAIGGTAVADANAAIAIAIAGIAITALNGECWRGECHRTQHNRRESERLQTHLLSPNAVNRRTAGLPLTRQEFVPDRHRPINSKETLTSAMAVVSTRSFFAVANDRCHSGALRPDKAKDQAPAPSAVRDTRR